MWKASFSRALDLILESFHVTGRLAGTSDGRMLGAFGRAKRGVVFESACISHQPSLSVVTFDRSIWALRCDCEGSHAAKRPVSCNKLLLPRGHVSCFSS